MVLVDCLLYHTKKIKLKVSSMIFTKVNIRLQLMVMAVNTKVYIYKYLSYRTT